MQQNRTLYITKTNYLEIVKQNPFDSTISVTTIPPYNNGIPAAFSYTAHKYLYTNNVTLASPLALTLLGIPKETISEAHKYLSNQSYTQDIGVAKGILEEWLRIDSGALE